MVKKAVRVEKEAQEAKVKSEMNMVDLKLYFNQGESIDYNILSFLGIGDQGQKGNAGKPGDRSIKGAKGEIGDR